MIRALRIPALVLSLATPGVAKSDELARFLPDSTLVYVTIPDLARSLADYRETAVPLLLAEEEVKKFVAPALARIPEQLASFRSRLDAAPDVERLSLALLDLESGEEAMELVIEISIATPAEVDAEADAAGPPLAALLRDLLAEAGFAPLDETWSAGGVDVEVLADGRGSTAHLAAVSPGHVLASVSRGTLTQVLERRSRKEGEAEDSLAASPIYREARGLLARDGDEAFLFLGLEAALGSLLADADERQRKGLELLGIHELRALAGAVRFSGKRVETRGAVIGGETPAGLLSLFEKEGISRPFRELLPDGGLWTLAFRIDPARCLALVREIQRQEQLEDLAVEVEQPLAEVELTAEGFAAAFTGEVGLLLSTGPMIVGPPGLRMVIGLSDAESAEKGLLALLEAQGVEPRARDESWGRLVQIEIGEEAGPLGGGVHLAFLEDRLLAVWGPDVGPLRLLVSQQKAGGNRLVETPGFREAASATGFTGDAVSLIHLDLPRLVQGGYTVGSLALGTLPEEQRAGLPVDARSLPALDTIMRHIGASLSFGRIEKGSYVFTGSSSVGPELMGVATLGAIVFPTVQNALAKSRAAAARDADRAKDEK